MVIYTKRILSLLSPIMKGLAQIMLQNNLWTGVFFLIGICFGSLTMGVAAIVSVISGTLTAVVLKYSKEEINSGIYGFSAGLVGVALLCFFQSNAIVWFAVVLGSGLATIIQHLFIRKNIPAFTFPFILVTWLLLGFFYFFPILVDSSLGGTDTAVNNYVTLFTRGIGQVIFQDNIMAGVFFLVGVLISGPIAAVYVLTSIALSAVLAFLFEEPASDIYLGLLSYNAVLCAITFAGKKKIDFALATVAVILSVIIMIGMRYMNLPALTFPFVLATWLTLMIKKRLFLKQ